MNDVSLESPQDQSQQQWRYEPHPGHWDEALRPSGMPRRHWRKLSVALREMGIDQMNRRWQIGQQLIRVNGITYNIYGDPQGKERPWQMDPIPLVIDPDEWDRIERALIQRATLLNHMLADLYGPQKLLHERHLPAALLFASPNFLRPCHGIVPPGGVFLHHYAADLARSPDGTWWVISDRTQAPSGIGYALENRLVSARTLPSIFNQCQVQPLARFFETMLGALMALASSRASSPRVVVLTPGPHNETYFEHAFLARHWALPLVEGADLAVRDNRVFLKTVTGLEPVDLIFRRLDDSFCDPLELRGDSLLGVPGLVQAVRAGNVAVANMLGSGLLETSSQMAFLPGLCRTLLGEDLRMPSVATWWCGQEEPRRYVLDHLNDLVIKPAFPALGQNAEFPASMSDAARRELAQRIESRPEQYVAQEQVDLSTAPIRTAKGLESRHVVLRAFAAWDGSSYTIMPGGLTRVSTGDRSLVVSMQLGGGSKDTWVMGQGQHRVENRPAEFGDTLSSSKLPSRAAENLFWLGRYAERLESCARLVRALLPGLSAEADFGRAASLETMIHLLGGLRLLPAKFGSNSIAQQRWHLQRLLVQMVFDPTRTFQIGWNLKQVRRVASEIKERFSTDTWQVLQQLNTDFSRTPPGSAEPRLLAAIGILDGAMITLSAFAGLLVENTTRTHAWLFLEIGRRLERALQTIELLRVGIAQAPFDIEPYLELLLQIADSSITYRTRYLTSVRTEFVLELLLADETNPRSVGFQVAALAKRVGNLPPGDTGSAHSEELLLVAAALTAIRSANMDDLAARDAQGNLGALEDFLLQLKTGLCDFADVLTSRYLSHLKPSRLTSSL